MAEALWKEGSNMMCLLESQESDENFTRLQWFIDGLLNEVFEVRSKLNDLISLRYSRRNSSDYAGADDDTKQRVMERDKGIHNEISDHLERIERHLPPLYALGDESVFRFKEVIERWFAFVKESNVPATQPDDVVGFQLQCDVLTWKVTGAGFATWQVRLTVDRPCEEWGVEYQKQKGSDQRE